MIWTEKAVPTVPDTVGAADSTGVVVIIGDPAVATTIFKAWLTTPAVVVAWIVTGNDPERVGVPEICPLPDAKLRPVGKVPVSANADGGVGNDVIW